MLSVITSCSSSAIEIEPGYILDLQGNQVPGSEILADDADSAVEQINARFAGFEFGDDAIEVVTEVDYSGNFVASATIRLCQPPVPVDPRIVIDGDTWRLEHSTEIDDNVDCEALRETWLLFVIDRQHRSLFTP